MKMRLNFTFCLVFLTFYTCHSLPSNGPTPPVFDKNYFIKGILLLPYAEIKEPFKAFYDEANGNSRVDYYGDMVQTYQRVALSEYGVSYKIAYMPDENGTPVRHCFQVNGSQAAPVSVQSILPDLSQFTFAKEGSCFDEYALPRSNAKDVTCEVWTSENVIGYKKNKYIMYLKKGTQEPVHYIMMGYDSLLGSHYDKYELYYSSYAAGNVTDDDFVIDTSIECGGFPGPGVEEMVLNNPMQEFINHEDRHIQDSFSDFKKKHGKSYTDSKEHASRQNIYRQNYRYVTSMNRAGLSYQLKINHLADYNDMEMHRIRGRLPSVGYNGGVPFPTEEFPKSVPSNLDWRLYGAVTPVKDQAICGSCWSFGTTGTIEGTYFLKNKQLVRLSQQQLIDCSWKYQNNGCDGGEDFRAYTYIIEAGGLASEEDYGHYLGEDGICHDRNVSKTAQITGFVNVTSEDLFALKQAIAKKGPISVSIDASPKSFSFYSYGVYYDPDCKSGATELDHSVLAVGYGVMNDEKYWIIKNSWSTYWGNDGYVLISQKNNNCGVATAPTYVLM